MKQIFYCNAYFIIVLKREKERKKGKCFKKWGNVKNRVIIT